MERRKKKMEKDKTMQDINVNKAWDLLYTRMKNDKLLPETNVTEYISFSKNSSAAKRIFRWAAVILIIGLTTTFCLHFLIRKDSQMLLSVKNNDQTSILVKTLEDGSLVFLAQNTTLSFPESFASDQRMVNLQGDAMFDISKDRDRPFIVETKNAIIEVLGTSFYIKSPSENTFELSVSHGKVKITDRGNNEQMIAQAGETVFLQKSGLQKKSSSNVRNFSYFTEKMSFKDEQLKNIINVINNSSEKKIILENESLNNRLLTVTFENNTTSSMVELICLALQLKQTTKDDYILISQP